MAATPPKLPTADAVDGTETLIGRKGNALFRFPLSLLKAFMSGAKGDPGPKGDPGGKGDPGTPGPTLQRALSTTTSAAGVGTITFATPYTETPEVLPVLTVVSPTPATGPQMVFGIPSNVTKTGCQITAYRTRGTLLLSASPLELAPNTQVSVVALGKVAS